MKWKNLDVGAGYYCITGTCTEWLPLLLRPAIRAIVCEEITRANAECGASPAEYVLMPEHLHLLAYLPKERLLHRYCRLWRGRSGWRIIDLLQAQEDHAVLAVLAEHANGECRYAVWKEQPRCLPIVSERKFEEKLNYIHANPVRRGTGGGGRPVALFELPVLCLWRAGGAGGGAVGALRGSRWRLLSTQGSDIM